MNIASMKKGEIVKRSNYKCKHGHTGLAHPFCYSEETRTGERIGFLDIEASNLKANFGIVLSYCIKIKGGEVIKRLITKEDLLSGEFDKHLLEQFCEDARHFDRLITFYGARFDMPFLRTRCIFYKLKFPVWGELKHSDVYDIAKRKLNLHSRRLGVICDFFGIAAKEHPITSDVWIKALSGNQKALEYIMVHNIEDVVCLEELWDRINEFSRITDTSI